MWFGNSGRSDRRHFRHRLRNAHGQSAQVPAITNKQPDPAGKRAVIRQRSGSDEMVQYSPNWDHHGPCDLEQVLDLQMEPAQSAFGLARIGFDGSVRGQKDGRPDVRVAPGVRRQLRDDVAIADDAERLIAEFVIVGDGEDVVHDARRSQRIDGQRHRSAQIRDLDALAS
ncbi:hypothetical protein BVRB_024630, partial [Beta vulgaris subsp. vulgaris]